MDRRLVSFNIAPLVRIPTSFNLDKNLFFKIVLDFLSHRREEILNAQLSKYFSPYDSLIKSKIISLLYRLIEELDRSEGETSFTIKNNIFYIEEKDYDDR